MAAFFLLQFISAINKRLIDILENDRKRQNSFQNALKTPFVYILCYKNIDETI